MFLLALCPARLHVRCYSGFGNCALLSSKSRLLCCHGTFHDGTSPRRAVIVLKTSFLNFYSFLTSLLFAFQPYQYSDSSNAASSCNQD